MTPFDDTWRGVTGRNGGAAISRTGTGALLAEAEALDDALVALEVVALQVVEQPAPLSHELEQPAAGMVILEWVLKCSVR